MSETKPKRSAVKTHKKTIGIPYTKKTGTEAGRKGGKVVTKKKIIINSLNSRKWCNAGCVMWPCPFQVISLTKEMRGKCALKEAPLKVQTRIVNLFTNGREGALKEYTRAICDISIKVDNDSTLEAKTLYFDRLGQYMERAYGRKILQENSGQIDSNITIKFKEPAWSKSDHKIESNSQKQDRKQEAKPPTGADTPEKGT